MTEHFQLILRFILLLLIAPRLAPAQTVSSVPDAQWLNRYPKKAYYQGLELYRDGDLKTATEAFGAALASCLRDENALWIDAIPVHAMLGECFYQAGDLRQSLLQIEASLALLSRHRDWIEALEWAAVSTNVFRPPDNRSAWVTTNLPEIVATPARLGFSVRDVKLPRSVVSSPFGAVAGRSQVDAVEILRGAAIAGYRRRLILGELADQSPQFVAQVRKREPASQPQASLRDKLLAAVDQCIRFASGKQQTVRAFQSLTTVQEAIHPLTPVLLLAAARQAIEQDQFAEAASVAWRAAETASLLGQSEYVAEALVLAIGCSEPQAVTARRAEAATAAVRYLRRGRLATLGALMAASEAALVDEDAMAAEKLLMQATALLQRRDVWQPRLAAHADYLAARLAARLGRAIGGSRPTAVDEAVQRLLTFANGPREGPASPTTPRRHQLNVAIAKSRQRGADAAEAQRLLGRLTADPPTWLWKADPVDALALHLFDRSPALARQLDLASQRDASTDLAVLSDSLLRHRFLAHLPLGGRLQQVRHITSADPELLVGPAAAMRAGGPENLQRLVDLLATPRAGAARSAIHGELLESLASEIALDRFALPEAMPRLLAPEADIQRMPADHAILIYVDLGGRFLGVLLQADGVQAWPITNSRILRTEVASVLRQIGVPAIISGSRIEQARPWRHDAAKLRHRLIPDEQLATLRDLKQLIVVPDGVLWYLPMELLPLSDASGEEAGHDAGSSGDQPVQLLVDQLSIHYSPTPGLAFSPAAPPVDEPLDTSLIATEDADPLRQWLKLPAQALRRVVLPGFRSAAEDTPIGDGRELFMTLTALRCSGARDVLISRWSVGGESTAGLMSELLQEIPFAGIHPAWRRSVELLRRNPLDPRSEPLLTGQDAQRDQLSGDHPLFWSGYLLATPIGLAD